MTLSRLVISVPCVPHEMVEFAKDFHPIPNTVESAIELGESFFINAFRELFGKVDVSYFNNKLTFNCVYIFMELYRNTTYYSVLMVKKFSRQSIQKSLTKDTFHLKRVLF